MFWCRPDIKRDVAVFLKMCFFSHVFRTSLIGKSTFKGQMSLFEFGWNLSLFCGLWVYFKLLRVTLPFHRVTLYQNTHCIRFCIENIILIPSHLNILSLMKQFLAKKQKVVSQYESFRCRSLLTATLVVVGANIYTVKR